MNNRLEEIRELAHQPPTWPSWQRINSIASGSDDTIVVQYATEVLDRWPEKYRIWDALMGFQFAHVHPGSFGCGVMERVAVRSKLLPWFDEPREHGWRAYKSSRVGLRDGRELLLNCKTPIIRELDSYLEFHFRERFGPWQHIDEPFELIEEQSWQRQLEHEITGPEGVYTGYFRGLGELGSSPPNDIDWPSENSLSNGDVFGWRRVEPPEQSPLLNERFYWRTETPANIEEYIRVLIDWGINNTRGHFAFDSGPPRRRRRVDEYDKELRVKQESEFVRAFVGGLGPEVGFFVGHHPSHNFIFVGDHSIEPALDFAFAAVDGEHIRMFWSCFHRHYG